jgi:small subunit ribosomal protein S9
MPRIIQETGKRKTSVARATLRPGTGVIRINGTPIERYEPALARMKLQEIFLVVQDPKLATVNISVNVSGGGSMSQVDASRIAISRAINKFLNKKKVTKAIKEYDKSMLSGDKRRTEPKKWGGRKARARVQKSYR